MTIISYARFIKWISALLIITGVFLILIDANSYSAKNLTREKRSALILGWTNVLLGITSFAGNWIYTAWFW